MALASTLKKKKRKRKCIQSEQYKEKKIKVRHSKNLINKK
jgi:hypothetical protein